MGENILIGVVGLVALAASAAGGLYAMRQVERWMIFMDRIYNPPGQRPFPVNRPW